MLKKLFGRADHVDLIEFFWHSPTLAKSGLNIIQNGHFSYDAVRRELFRGSLPDAAFQQAQRADRLARAELPMEHEDDVSQLKRIVGSARAYLINQKGYTVEHLRKVTYYVRKENYTWQHEQKRYADVVYVVVVGTIADVPMMNKYMFTDLFPDTE